MQQFVRTLTMADARPVVAPHILICDRDRKSQRCAASTPGRGYPRRRKTGYKIFDRYKDCGVGAFNDRSRRPYRQANRLPPQLEATIVRLKREYPGWGAPKIREKLRRQSTAPHLPAISTVHAVLDRHGLVPPASRHRHRAVTAERAERALVRRLQG